MVWLGKSEEKSFWRQPDNGFDRKLKPCASLEVHIAAGPEMKLQCRLAALSSTTELSRGVASEMVCSKRNVGVSKSAQTTGLGFVIGVESLGISDSSVMHQLVQMFNGGRPERQRRVDRCTEEYRPCGPYPLSPETMSASYLDDMMGVTSF